MDKPFNVPDVGSPKAQGGEAQYRGKVTHSNIVNRTNIVKKS